jgi:formiminoglutamase
MASQKDITVFLQAVNISAINEGYTYQAMQIGNVVTAYNSQEFLPELKDYKVALLGVCEERNTLMNQGTAQAPDEIRRHLYKLFLNPAQISLLDLGNIMAGHTADDTYFAVSEVVTELVRNNVIPIIIGGGQDITYAAYKAYESLEQLVNLVSVDPSIDFGFMEDEFDARSFLSRIVMHQPNYLFNYSNIGYQTYFVDPNGIELMNKLFFDSYRLGFVRDNLEEVEPIVRNADMISLDVSSIRQSEAPGTCYRSPNGFYGEEICQIAWYAGISDKLSSFGIYEMNPSMDKNGQTAHLCAQIIWCFMDGVASRRNDIPLDNDENYYKYRVFIPESKHEIVFYKSLRTNRWWMSVPYPPAQRSKYERHHLVPCTYADYQLACNDNLPDRWWQTFQKLI